MKQKHYESAEIAAKWWANKLDKTQEKTNETETLIKEYLEKHKAISQEKKEKFEKLLCRFLDLQLKHYGKAVLSILDKAPSGLLFEVALLCDLPVGSVSPFPERTTMYIEKKFVKICDGNLGDTITIYDASKADKTNSI